MDLQALRHRESNRRVVEQFRGGGTIDGMQRDRLVLLTTIGRRTGHDRTTPLMFHREDDRLLVIASNVGAPRHPQWYLNRVADPHVTVEIDDESYPVPGGHDSPLAADTDTEASGTGTVRIGLTCRRPSPRP